MKKILVVDDSLMEREFVRKSLQEENYEITMTDNGEDALSLIADNEFDLIILDVVMPGKNGFQVCREIKKNEFTSDIPVILVTSKGQESDKFWGKKQGADEYIVKPFEAEDLIAAVKRLIQ